MVGLAGRDTAIGDAIGLAVKRLRQQPPDNRVLVLLADGANSAGAMHPLQAATLAADSAVRIHGIGLGGRVGDRGVGGYQLGRVAEDLDEGVLRAIAAATGGRYFQATDARELDEVYAALDRLEPTIREHRTYRPATELYPLPAALALLLSALMVVVLVWRQRPRAGAVAADAAVITSADQEPDLDRVARGATGSETGTAANRRMAPNA